MVGTFQRLEEHPWFKVLTRPVLVFTLDSDSADCEDGDSTW